MVGSVPRYGVLAIACAFAGCAIGVGGGTDSSALSVGEGGSSGADGGTADDGSAGDMTMDDGATGADTTDDPKGGDPELCNGIDDDADGEIDEGIGELSCGMGICLATVPGCAGGVPGQCFPGQPGDETCNGLDDDCDGATDEELVQACDSSCGAGTQACAGGAWAVCDAPPPQAESCDVVDNDCNGQVDDGVAGCQVGIHRSWHPTTGEHFYTSSLDEAQCCGFTLEVSDFFRLYAGVQAQTTAFYRCYGAGSNGTFHHYTTDAACEGLPVNEGIIGYIGTAELAGSTALYRSYNPANGDHFFTNSEAEHDNAVGVLGFVDEGVVGYVW